MADLCPQKDMYSTLRSISRRLLLLTLISLPALTAMAQSGGNVPEIHGTIRGKYEYQTSEGQGRFEVRNARMSVSGSALERVDYKAEIDLSDEGKIKRLDAYVRLLPVDPLQLTIGQMRVPFTIDAHRSPHQQYFANRSFLAKQVGNVRDVGAMMGSTFTLGIPVKIEAGLFNGSGLTNQKDYWTKRINYSAKLTLMPARNVNTVLSIQKIRPDVCTVMMYDAGLNVRFGGLFIEGEYLYKHYSHNAFHDVHSFDIFACRDIPLRRCFFTKVSPLIRYDYMSDHSDGIRYLDGSENADGRLIINDYKRSRLTAGMTWSIGKPFVSDIRLNYEQYFYRHDAVPKVSEKNKIVVELMTRF